MKVSQKNATETSDSDSEYTPAIKVKDEEKKDKGKGKMKERDDHLDNKNRRRPPKPTELVRDAPCLRCVKKKMTCYKQVGGRNACLACATMKIRCVVFKDKQPKSKSEKTPTKIASPSATRRKRQNQTKIADMTEEDEETSSASSSGHSGPVAKHQKPSQKAERKSAKRWEETGEILGIRGNFRKKIIVYYLMIFF
jgi:hypothetical protein